MTFGQSIRAGFRRYAGFTGTASRSEFWWWILFTVLVATALAALPVPTFPLDGTSLSAPTLTPVWQLAVLLPTLAVTVRRLRDSAFGWGHIFWVLFPVVGAIVLAVLCSQRSTNSSAPTPAVAPAGVLR